MRSARGTQRVWGGYWNSHLGRECLSAHVGQHRMRQLHGMSSNFWIFSVRQSSELLTRSSQLIVARRGSTQHLGTGASWMSLSQTCWSTASVACEQFPYHPGIMCPRFWIYNFLAIRRLRPRPRLTLALLVLLVLHMQPAASSKLILSLVLIVPTDRSSASGQTSCAGPPRRHGNVERFLQKCLIAFSKTNVGRLQIPLAGPRFPRFVDVSQRKWSVATKELWRSLPWLVYGLRKVITRNGKQPRSAIPVSQQQSAGNDADGAEISCQPLSRIAKQQ